MKRNLFYGISLLLFCVTVSSCKSQNDAAGSGKIVADSILTGIERGPCFGTCPEYKSIIYTTGMAEYFGGRNNARQGYFQAHLSGEQLSGVKRLLKKYKMAEADSEYVNKLLADYPAYWLLVRDEKGSRKILISHEEPPANIRDFTVELDKLVANLPWKELKRNDDR